MHDYPMERWLTDNGYAWKFVEKQPLNEVDWNEALKNPMRHDRAFDDNRCYQYACDMEAGADFPAILLHEIAGRSLKRVWGGVHRGHAAMVAQKPISAIVVREADGFRVELAMRVANSIGVGIGETENGKLHHIAELKRRYPFAKPLDLAKHFRVKKDTVTKYLQVIAAQDRAQRAGVPEYFKKLAQDLQIELTRLQSDTVITAAVGLIESHPSALRGAEGMKLARDLRGIGYEVRALARLSDIDKELTEREREAKAQPIRTPQATATKWLSKVRSVKTHHPGSVQQLHVAGVGTWQTCRREAKMLFEVIDLLTDAAQALLASADEKQKAAEWNKRESRQAGDLASDLSSRKE